MRNSKSIAISFLLGTLLAGGTLGFAADRLTHSGRAGARPEMRSRLKHDLQLNAEQGAKVDSILERRNRDFEAELDPIRTRLDSIRRKARSDIRGVLSLDQRQAFDRFLQRERRQESR